MLIYVAVVTYIWYVPKIILRNCGGSLSTAWEVLGGWVSNFCS